MRKILHKLCKASVICAISQGDYEGAIKKLGDTVLLRALSKDEKVELVIDQEASFAFSGAAKDCEIVGIELARFVDGKLFAKMVHSAPASNKGNAAGFRSNSLQLGEKTNSVLISKDNIVDVINDMEAALDENGVSFDKDRDSDRWGILPSAMLRFIRKADIKNTSPSDSLSYNNGRIGDIDGMTVYVSNDIPTSFSNGNTVYHIPFGHKDAFGFVCDIRKNHLLYGAKVLNEGGLGVCYASAL